MTNIKNEQFRAFHLTGNGLEHLAPQGPLRPVLLDGGPAIDPRHGDGEGTKHLLDLYAKALNEQRSKARHRFLANVRYCRDRMEELLTLDDSRDPSVSSSPAAISAALGSGGSFLDTGALAVALQTPAAHPVQRMEPARRKRCEETYKVLHDYLAEAVNEPAYWEFPSADAGAVAFCERRLDMLAATLRAVRVARLEMDASYNPDIHDIALSRFNWESADAEELSAMPAVLVVDSADRVAENSLTSFGRLLRSGLPMQILITCPHFYTGDLAFLAVAHREAFVMQSSVRYSEHLHDGLMDMTHTLRPAVAVVAVDDPSIAVRSRVFPMFVYDPEAGEDWVQRFRLFQPGEPAPEGCSSVHLAAVSADLAPKHFRLIAKEDWTKEQLELAEYLKQFGKQAPLAEPYLLVVNEKGEQQRALITRELIYIARDRQKAFRLLEELAEAGKPPAPVVDTNQVRQDATKEAILSVVAMLTGGGAPPPAAAAPATAAAPAAAAGQPATAAPAAAAAASMDPYIDSSLCTSCNDCMKVNSRMFLYNGDKQAYLGDPSTGTFAELVKAAEGCPAKCIHPGTPRPGDRTATPQLIARAGKYNS